MMDSPTSSLGPGLFRFDETSASRQITIGLLLALLAHLLILLLAVVWLIVEPVVMAFILKLLPPRPAEPAPAKPPEIELTIVPAAPKEEPAPPPMIEANPQRAFLDSRGLAEAPEAAKDAMIESDKNMKAASEMPATGDLPLPSQDGLSRPTPNFTTQQDTLGGKSEPVPAAPALYKPQPIPKANIDPATQEPARNLPMPAPAVETPPTLPQIAEMNAIAQRALEKLKQVMEADEDEIPLTTKPMVTPPKELTEPAPDRPRPVPVAQPQPAAPPAPRQEMAKLTTPPPRAPQAGYQPQLQKTRIEGSISNRGKAAVDAVSTPLARYKKQVNDAIGSRWYYYIRGKMDLIAAGSVHMSFSINERGEAVGVRIDSNTSNQSLADVCERAIRDAELEPPPPDLLAPLKDGRLDYSLTFTFYNL
jgi:outer membrane biosynthesis protein TonB